MMIFQSVSARGGSAVVAIICIICIIISSVDAKKPSLAEFRLRPQILAPFASRQQQQQHQSNNNNFLFNTILDIRGGSTSIQHTRGGVQFLREDGLKSRVTGLPLFAEWLYPVLDIISSIFFVSVILGCFKDEARTFWIRIITGHIILMFITNYGKTIPIRWNLPIVPVKVMGALDICVAIASLVHPLIYPEGYGWLLWYWVIIMPIFPILTVLSFSLDPDNVNQSTKSL